ncbi:MAG: diacylglycerol kinase family protein [Gammaproteobacteria bacterium]|nr:diacylglycerol kinase family protein [Gammaproteobacteria bacterium]
MVRGRIASFRYAFAGLWVMIRTQPNAWIHAVATLVVVGAGIHFALPGRDWALLVCAIGLVWMGEALNTAIEFLADAAVPAHHPLIKHAKDIAAAAVLLASLAAALIGALVFAPHLLL